MAVEDHPSSAALSLNACERENIITDERGLIYGIDGLVLKEAAQEAPERSINGDCFDAGDVPLGTAVHHLLFVCHLMPLGAVTVVSSLSLRSVEEPHRGVIYPQAATG